MDTNWYPEIKLVVTRISGNVDLADVETWERSLFDALEKIPAGGDFRIFVDLYGFKAVNFETHKRFRTIIPLTLARYGWRTGYVDLFEEEARGLELSITNNTRCIAAAHCHQDETKISLYEERFSRSNERYFTDRDTALAWISSL